MSWKKTSIIVSMENDKYPTKDNIKKFTFNNIVEEPTSDQIKEFVEGLLLLSDGDSYLGAEIVRHEEQGAN